MVLYTVTDSNEIQIRDGSTVKTIARIPNDFMAATIRRHLNEPRGIYYIVDIGKISELHAQDGESLLSTHTTSFNPKTKPLTRTELEEFLAHLNR